MATPLILAIDQGTTSSRAIVFDGDLRMVASAQQEFEQIYPREGWVEHDPEALWSTTLGVTRKALVEAERHGGQVVAIGITNQRETALIWDRETGAPLCNAIVWQDRRTADVCKRLAAAGHGELVRARTGLLLDPYFSATKIAWMLDQTPGARALAEQGRLAFGTVDTFLIWRLTGGEVHATDATNASRTSLYNIVEHRWDDELLELFGVPRSLLPEVRDCAADFGVTHRDLLGREIPIFGVAGDQQAATIGQACFHPGQTKATYGTGAFVVVNTGAQLVQSSHRLLSTIASRLEGEVQYALEGSIFVAGAAVQWLRDRLRLIGKAADTEALAQAPSESTGLYLVPAFVGLGAPHWDAQARGALIGMTLGTSAADIVRATLESVAYQTADLFDAMAADGCAPATLRVDGGMVANDWLVQHIADVLDLPVERPTIMETTALGAAWLAGRQAGVYGDQQWFAERWQVDRHFAPTMEDTERLRRLGGWRRALARVLSA